MDAKIYASQEWVRNEAFSAEYALEIIMEMDVIEPLRSIDGTIYTAPDGVIYTL